MKHRCVLFALALAAVSTVYAVNDFWLGQRYSVRLSFSAGDLGKINAPVPKVMPMPEYPNDFLRAAMAGSVTINFVVQGNGGVSDVSVVKASSNDLAEHTRKVVEQWRFTPAIDLKSRNTTVARMQCCVEYLIDEAAPNRVAGGN
jgi:TonB family protein